MSLKAFEQAWLDLLLDPAARSARQSGDAYFHGLTPAERTALQALPQEELNEQLRETQSQRLTVLEAALPQRIRQLLGPESSRALLAELAENGSLPPLYPRRQLLAELLAASLDYLGRRQLSVPHLRDMIQYELAAAELDFFCLPRPLPPTPGPRLAEWARVLRLGSRFALLLESLHRGYPAQDLAETPKQRFLLTREFRGLRLEAPPPLVAACLEACDGKTPWEEVAQVMLRQQPELAEGCDPGSLPGWYQHYLQRGVLIESTL